MKITFLHYLMEGCAKVTTYNEFALNNKNLFSMYDLKVQVQ